jgi:hypothetical protein
LRPLSEAPLRCTERTYFSSSASASFSRAAFVPARLGPGSVRAWREFAFARFAHLRLAVLSFCRFAQVLQLFRVELANIARLQIENERAVPNPANLLHVMADLLEHLAELAVAALNENHFVPGIIDWP